MTNIRVTSHGIYDIEKCVAELQQVITKHDPQTFERKLEQIKTIVFEAHLQNKNPEFDVKELIIFLDDFILASARSRF